MGLELDRRMQETSAAAGLRRWLIPLAIVVLSGFAELGGTDLRELLRYAREPLLEGEWWRLVSGHLVHLGWGHWAMNALALVAIWWLIGAALPPGQWLIACAIVLASIDAGFWYLDAGLIWYVGLSGLLHGLLLTGLLVSWRERPGETAVLTGLLLAKLLYEQLSGPLPGSSAAAGGPVVVNAHLYGAVGGLLAMLVLRVSVAEARS